MKRLLKLISMFLGGAIVLVLVAVAGALIWRGQIQKDVRLATQISSPDGIDVLEKISLGGTQQWIHVRGHDRANPVLLFLHGGPGSPEMAAGRVFGAEVEKHFTVVHWDQRASGKSRRETYDEDSLTVAQYLSDTLELINLLRARFDQDKIYLVGHSWGSGLGVLTARDHPELLHAYVGMGQIVNMVENERLSWEFTMETARREGNERALAELKDLTPPYTDTPAELFVQRKWLTRFKGSFYGITMKDLGEVMWASPEYSVLDIAAFFVGTTAVPKIMWPELGAIDFFTQAPKLDVPVYFFTGRHDYNTPFELAERYYEMLEAPHKEIVWFENSGHFPNMAESERYQTMLIEKVLAATSH